jgi:hypothetical protein
MPTNDLQSCVDGFVADISALIRRAAYDAASTALRQSGSAPLAAPARRKPGRPVGSTTAASKTAGASKASAKPAGATRRKPGEKRDPRDLAAAVEKLHAYIKANPGQRMEVIGAALGLPRADLALPIKKLLADKRISRRGVKRATVYTAAASSASNGGLVLVKKRKKVDEDAGGAAAKADGGASAAPASGA